MTNVQKHEVLAWLGPTLQDLTDEQVTEVWNYAEGLWLNDSTADNAPEREAQLSVFVKAMLGEAEPYGTWDKPILRAFEADGTEVMPGDTLTDFRGESGTKYLGCTHPRKINTDSIGVTRYPSVFNLEIRGPEGYIWNPVSDEGRRLAQLQRERGE